MGRSIFVTGAEGYIGRRVIDRIEAARRDRAVLLLHRPANDERTHRFDTVVGDLLQPETYSERLKQCDTVIHLAAVTGKARRAAYFRVNSEGTRALVGASRTAGIRSFLHISSIAAGFADQTGYYYGQSKKRSEEIVTASDLSYVIVRPTIVLGRQAPVLSGLRRLASMPVVPVFGNGRVQVQPVFVDDLVDCLMAILNENVFGGETIEIGGPETTSIEDLLLRIRRHLYDRLPRVVHLPLRPIRAMLAFVEPLLLPVLPMTAGQLASFANDSTATSHPFIERRHAAMAGIDAVLRMSDDE